MEAVFRRTVAGVLFLSAAMLVYTVLLPRGKLSAAAKTALLLVMFTVVLSPLASLREMAPAALWEAPDAAFDASAEAVGAACEQRLQAALRERLAAVTEVPFTAAFTLHIDEAFGINIEGLTLSFSGGGVDRAQVSAAVRELFSENLTPVIELPPP